MEKLFGIRIEPLPAAQQRRFDELNRLLLKFHDQNLTPEEDLERSRLRISERHNSPSRRVDLTVFGHTCSFNSTRIPPWL